MDTLDVLLNVIPFFEKDIIGFASVCSFKKALVSVEGYNNVNVPRESVYQTELDRILVKWLGTQRNFEVTGQWHLTHFWNYHWQKFQSRYPAALPNWQAAGQRHFHTLHHWHKQKKVPCYQRGR